MGKSGKGRVWYGISLIFVVGAAIVIGYILGMKKGSEGQERLTVREMPIKEDITPQKEPAPAKEKITIPFKEIAKENKESTSSEPKDLCEDIETRILQFFTYLNKKNYIQHLEADADTNERFRQLIRTLSSQPPIPAGEGVDSRIMMRNIFYFFRILDKKDLRLIRALLRNEADTLELNLQLFYRWLMLGDHCPDRENIRPTLNILYLYAGFFMNTIGGRSYLFRRPTALRLLLSYYCLLILHEADKRGENNYGIDIFPEISGVAREIIIYPDFHFQKEYANKLKEMHNYYLKRR